MWRKDGGVKDCTQQLHSTATLLPSYSPQILSGPDGSTPWLTRTKKTVTASSKAQLDSRSIDHSLIGALLARYVCSFTMQSKQSMPSPI